jgi:hypothetical protein
LIEGLLELLVPGHFHVALSDSEKTQMRSAATQILNKGYKLPEPVRTSDQVGGLNKWPCYQTNNQDHKRIHRGLLQSCDSHDLSCGLNTSSGV